MNVKIFVKDGCARCPTAKLIGEELQDDGYPVEIHNMSTIEGLTAGAFCGVMSTPTIIVLDAQDKEVKSWRGEVPTIEEIKKILD